jgi:hypothetical protein
MASGTPLRRLQCLVYGMTSVSRRPLSSPLRNRNSNHELFVSAMNLTYAALVTGLASFLIRSCLPICREVFAFVRR